MCALVHISLRRAGNRAGGLAAIVTPPCGARGAGLCTTARRSTSGCTIGTTACLATSAHGRNTTVRPIAPQLCGG
ncbi:hypothetical protein T492DRAFT_948084 [Pavlovales sp. CCMP2436]|nr:hypothetical protein T492DRAFT_948084 [Pavlovales sp. CCMP2436]